MKVDFKTVVLGRHIEFKYYKEYGLESSVVGLNSNLTKNAGTERWFENHFLMIDYDDNLSLNNLINEVKRLQEKFSLPDAYIFESSYRHYNVVFFGVCRDYFDCLKIIHDTPCCESFKSWRMIRQEMTIRMSPKLNEKPPVLVYVVLSDIGEYDEHIADNFIIKQEIDSIRKFVLYNCPAKLPKGQNYRMEVKV